jgi:hypothetical protein
MACNLHISSSFLTGWSIWSLPRKRNISNLLESNRKFFDGGDMENPFQPCPTDPNIAQEWIIAKNRYIHNINFELFIILLIFLLCPVSWVATYYFDAAGGKGVHE